MRMATIVIVEDQPDNLKLLTTLQRKVAPGSVLVVQGEKTFDFAKLPAAVFGPELGAWTDLTRLLEALEAEPHPKALAETLEATLQQLTKEQGPEMDRWQWGRLHQIDFQHPLKAAQLRRGPVARPGDGFTVNSTAMARTVGSSSPGRSLPWTIRSRIWV